MHYVVKSFDAAILDYKSSLNSNDGWINKERRQIVLKELSKVINEEIKNKDVLSSEDYYFLAEEKFYSCPENPSHNNYGECRAQIIKYCNSAFELDDGWIKDNDYLIYYLRGLIYAVSSEYDKFLKDLNMIKEIYKRNKRTDIASLISKMELILKTLDNLDIIDDDVDEL